MSYYSGEDDVNAVLNPIVTAVCATALVVSAYYTRAWYGVRSESHEIKVRNVSLTLANAVLYFATTIVTIVACFNAHMYRTNALPYVLNFIITNFASLLALRYHRIHRLYQARKRALRQSDERLADTIHRTTLRQSMNAQKKSLTAIARPSVRKTATLSEETTGPVDDGLLSEETTVLLPPGWLDRWVRFTPETKQLVLSVVLNLVINLIQIFATAFSSSSAGTDRSAILAYIYAVACLFILFPYWSWKARGVQDSFRFRKECIITSVLGSVLLIYVAVVRLLFSKIENQRTFECCVVVLMAQFILSIYQPYQRHIAAKKSRVRFSQASLNVPLHVSTLNEKEEDEDAAKDIKPMRTKESLNQWLSSEQLLAQLKKYALSRWCVENITFLEDRGKLYRPDRSVPESSRVLEGLTNVDNAAAGGQSASDDSLLISDIYLNDYVAFQNLYLVENCELELNISNPGKYYKDIAAHFRQKTVKATIFDAIAREVYDNIYNHVWKDFCLQWHAGHH